MDIANITCTEVRHVLRHLARDRTPGDTPLAELEVVHQGLTATGFRLSPRAKQFEVGRLLAQVVEDELIRLRDRHGVPTLGRRVPVEQQIEADFSRGHRELEAWSAIYHLYLRPDLDLRLQRMVELLGDRHRRTVQRRLGRGVRALTQRLRRLEREASIEARRSADAGRPPDATASRLIGVGAAARRMAKRLDRTEVESVVALGGPGGIGKTSLALHVSERAVEQDTFDEVVWLSAANGLSVPDDIVAQLQRTTSYPDPAATEAASPLIREGGAVRRCLYVVDGLDEPRAAAVVARAARQVPRPSKVVLTGRVGWSLCPEVRAIELSTLEPDDAIELVRHEAAVRGLSEVAEADDALLEPLVRATHGHPLAIRLAVGQLRAADLPTVIEDLETGGNVAGALYRDLWAAAWERAPEEVRAVVEAVIALEDDDRVADRTAIGQQADRPAQDVTSGLRAALDAGLLTPGGTVRRRTYEPGLFLRRYLVLRQPASCE